MRIARLVIFVIGAAFFDAIVSVALKEVGIQLGALPMMLKVESHAGVLSMPWSIMFSRAKRTRVLSHLLAVPIRVAAPDSSAHLIVYRYPI